MFDCQDTINSISVSLVIVYGKRADLTVRSKTNVHLDVSFLTAKVVITTCLLYTSILLLLLFHFIEHLLTGRD